MEKRAKIGREAKMGKRGAEREALLERMNQWSMRMKKWMVRGVSIFP